MSVGVIGRLGLPFGPQGVGFPVRLGAGGIALACRGRRMADAAVPVGNGLPPVESSCLARRIMGG